MAELSKDAGQMKAMAGAARPTTIMSGREPAIRTRMPTELSDGPSNWKPITLPAAEEQKFQKDFRGSEFFKEFKQRYGEEPNLDGDYDYRGWWKSSGLKATRHQDGTLHGPSKTPDGKWLKAPDHKTAWMETFMAKTGENPEELGLESREEADRYIRIKRRR